ncbi:branched-chain amino acid ABC transporter permease [Candidatus Parcubacteria bacterium]|nr:MAG: branched-chain amino acid ABC transporter permease [Candidatus Parcubacteria bacterium]
MGYLFTTIARVWETSLAAIGGHLTLSLGGILFLGFPAAFWCGAYGYALAAKAGMSLGISFAIGGALAASAGGIFAFFYSRISNDSFAVITLASFLALEALIRSWDSVTGGVLGIAGVPRFSFAQALRGLVLFEAYVVIPAFILESFLANGPFGRSLRALKENKTALIAMGTSANVIGQAAVVFASLFVGVSGILAASRVQFLDPSLGGIFLLTQTLTVAIIANTPKTLRLLGVTVAVVLLPEFLRFLDLPLSILGHARNVLYGFLLIILIYYAAHKTPLKRYV